MIKLSLSLGATALLIAACSSGSSTNGPSLASESDGGVATAPASTGGDAHTPATGCRTGFEACTSAKPPVCAHLADDYAHCGSCEKSCSGGSCVAGTCVADSMACPYGAMCGTACVKDRSSNVDHCGSCFDRCADGQLCAGGVCTSGDGNGSSCASPQHWDVDADERAGFRTGVTEPAMFVFPCGPLAAVPTRWFRFTGTKDKTNVSVDSSNASDALVLAVYSSSACDGTVLVGCSADKVEPNLDVPNALGKTFFVAVGSVSVAGPVPAVIRVDH